MMLQKTYSIHSPNESYYFQLVPMRLIIIGSISPPQNSTAAFKFSLFKGKQKSDQNRIAIPAFFDSTGKLDFDGLITLNFNIPAYLPNRKVEFTLKMIYTDQYQTYEIGSCPIDCNEMITRFKSQKANYFLGAQLLSDNYELEYQIFAQQSKIALEKVIKQVRNQVKVQTTSQSHSQPNIDIQNSPLYQLNQFGDKMDEISQKGSKQSNSQQKINYAKPPMKKKFKVDPNYCLSWSVPDPKLMSPQKQCQQQIEQQKQKKNILIKIPKLSIQKKQSLQSINFYLPDSPLIKIKNKQQQNKLSRKIVSYQIKQNIKITKNIKIQEKNNFYLLKIIIFISISFFLIYYAMIPSKKYYSKRRRQL